MKIFHRLIERYLSKIADKICSMAVSKFDSACFAQDVLINDQVSQKMLEMHYRKLVVDGEALPNLRDVGFRRYSQNDEDGILLYLFTVAGVKNKTCIEICAGDGIECNVANLIINHGWNGLLVDGNIDAVNHGISYYSQCADTRIFPPKFINAWVTLDNVNEIIRDNGFDGEVDLLSLDMDGVDYWIWKAITVISPRIVVLEYQDILGPELSLTVPYGNDFIATDYPMTKDMPNFCGASLHAFVKLANTKGYRLVGVNKYGFNAFFIKNGICDHLLPEISIESCFEHPKVKWGICNRYPLVKDFPWVEV